MTENDRICSKCPKGSNRHRYTYTLSFKIRDLSTKLTYVNAIANGMIPDVQKADPQQTLNK